MVSGSRPAVCCTSDREDGHVEEPWSAVQFQCRGLELGTLPAGRPRVAESFRGSS